MWALCIFVGVPTQYIIPWRCKAIDVVFCYHREYLDVAFALRWCSMFRLWSRAYAVHSKRVYPWLLQSAQCKEHSIVVVLFYVFFYLLHAFNNGEMKIINLKQTRCRIQFAGYILYIKLHMRCTVYTGAADAHAFSWVLVGQVKEYRWYIGTTMLIKPYRNRIGSYYYWRHC